MYWLFPSKELAHLPFFQIKERPTDLPKQKNTFKLRRFHPLDEIDLHIFLKMILFVHVIELNSSLCRGIAVKKAVGSFLLSGNAVHLISESFDVVQRVSDDYIVAY